MSATAQVLANRQNSLRSTGPKTAFGKAASSSNATRHGLTSKHIVIPGEDPVEYDAHRQALIEEYSPAGETERTLVEEIAASAWRLLRARRFETAVLKKLLGDCADPAAAFAEAFLHTPKELDRLQRYVTAIERAYFRALNTLEKLQKPRKEAETRREVLATWVEGTDIDEQENGFVSQQLDDDSFDARSLGKGRAAHAA